MKKSDLIGLVFIGILVLLLIGAWALILSGNFPSLIAAIPTATATLAPTNTATLTPTLAPTNTSTPTPTPENTATPTPIPTDTPTPIPPFPTVQAVSLITTRTWQIAYMAAPVDNWEIFVADIDGSNRQNISVDSNFDAFPTWSAQAEKIVWATDRYGPGLDIVVADIDGENLVNLTNTPDIDDFSPIWSPNGQLISFLSTGFGDLEVFVTTLEGTNYNVSNHEATDVALGWSRSCNTLKEGDTWSNCQILMGSNRGKDSGEDLTLYAVSPDGETFDLVTDFDVSVIEAVYSADGTQVAYTKEDEEDELIDIFVWHLESGEETRLTNDEAIETNLAWSPTGEVIAYIVAVDEANDIYAVSVIDGTVTNLTNTPPPISEGLNDEFRWSPDGTQILFSSDRTGNADIFVMDADGNNVINLTESDGPEIEAIWIE